MDWIKAHQRLLSWIVLGVGALLLIAGIGFYIIDARLVEELHMNAKTVNELFNGLRGLVGAGAGDLVSGNVGGMFGSQMGEVASTYANSLFEQKMDEMLAEVPASDRAMIQGALFLLPLIPQKLIYVIAGVVLVAVGLFGVMSAAPKGRGSRKSARAPRASAAPRPSAAPTADYGTRAPAAPTAYIPCPGCGQMLPREYKACPYCGRRLTSVGGAASASPSVPPTSDAPKSENPWIHPAGEL